jgi:hypothetical protein
LEGLQERWWTAAPDGSGMPGRGSPSAAAVE